MRLAIHFLLIVVVAAATACSGNPMGKKVKNPMSGSAYESNNRFFRAVGKAQSSKENIARKKASMEAKSELASQVNVIVKEVSDQYMQERATEDADDVSEKFQSLVREVMNTSISDLRKFDEKTYHNGEKYTVFVAYEIKKKAMFRFMKKHAKAQAKWDAATRNTIEELIDKKMEEFED